MLYGKRRYMEISGDIPKVYIKKVVHLESRRKATCMYLS